MEKIRSTTAPTVRGFSCQALARALFAAEIPEQAVRALPAQSLYLALKHNDLAASADIIAMASIEQCRLLMDFDCWANDQLSEEQLWEWLGLSDEEHGLQILQKILKCIDLKLVALLISRHVTIHSFTEKTENPPAPGFYTPDMGHTWLSVNLEDAENSFRLSRLLALIFETSAELFYQLCSIPGVSTNSLLEEEAFEERTKRLLAEGVPDMAIAHEIHQHLSDDDVIKMCARPGHPPAVRDIPSIEPLVHSTPNLEPFDSTVAALQRNEAFESELTLIMNAALVRFQVPLFDSEKTFEVVAAVKGALNIGLESAVLVTKLSGTTCLERLGLQALYRLGITKVLAIRKMATKIAQPPETDLLGAAVLDGLRLPIPMLPEALNDSGELTPASDGTISTKFRPLQHLDTIKLAVKILERIGAS